MKIYGRPILIFLLSFFLISAGHAQSVVTNIAAGSYHSLFVKSDGSLWVMGRNDSGALGDGTYGGAKFPYATNLPEKILASGVTAIAGGLYHSLIVQNGNLLTTGDNQYGELGDGTSDHGAYQTNRPEVIVSGGVTAVAAGEYFSLFLQNGALLGMGNNNSGQLGDGTQTASRVPEIIMGASVIAVSASSYHTLFLTSDGSLWAIGSDEHGELGDGNTTDDAVTNAERIVIGGVTAVAAGDFHSLFLKNDGSLWAMGENSSGQLGDGTYSDTNQPEMIVPTGVVAIAAGGGHSLFIKKDGSLWAMGSDSFGQLGDGSTDGGNFQTNRPEMIVASGVTTIAAGEAHSLFIKSDGSLWAMGNDQYGQLGDGVYRNNGLNLPEQIVAGSSMPPDYNQISAQLLSTGAVAFSFVGDAQTKYSLDRTFDLSPPHWIPQVTNIANASGIVNFTNTPDGTTNNFWRVRSVP
ncbi:MAG TPA: hypothetical protein VGO67_24555 [Verrucomicrobiae bacterium]|jgi:alpha-tubulin suppressor-like RCC1 family protein